MGSYWSVLLHFIRAQDGLFFKGRASVAVKERYEMSRKGALGRETISWGFTWESQLSCSFCGYQRG